MCKLLSPFRSQSLLLFVSFRRISRLDAEPFNQDREVIVASARAGGLPTQPVQEARDCLWVIVEMGSKMLPKPVVRVHDLLPVCRAAGRWKAEFTEHVYTPPYAFMGGDRQERIWMTYGKSATHLKARELACACVFI